MVWWFCGTAFADDPLVMVAAHALAVGDVIEVGDLYAVRVPPEAWPLWVGGGLHDPAPLFGRTVTEPLLAHEPVLPRRVGLPQPQVDPGPGHAGVVAQVSTEPVWPGDRVDLVRPAQAGCRVVETARVLRVGGGAVLVEVPQELVHAVVVAEVAAVPAGEGKGCTGPAPVASPLPTSGPGPALGAVEVAYAARDVAPGDVLERKSMVIVRMPRDLVPDAIRVTAGAKATAPLARGEAIREERVTAGREPVTPFLGGVTVDAAPGAPWWPGDALALWAPGGCVLEARMLASLTVRRADVQTVDVRTDPVEVAVASSAFRMPVARLGPGGIVVETSGAPPAGSVPVVLPADGLPPAWRPCP